MWSRVLCVSRESECGVARVLVARVPSRANGVSQHDMCAA